MNKNTGRKFRQQSLEIANIYISGIRGCPIIIRTDILHHTSKTIAPRVKSQARGHNNWSRALK